jgi:adenine-specific DNA methylase
VNKKIIEYWFPIKEIGKESQKESGSGGTGISGIHTYFARRPTCSARAIILASLLQVPDSDEKLKEYFNLIKEIGKRNFPKTIQIGRKNNNFKEYINQVINFEKINLNNISAFDPFSGGGTFPHEILNFGMKTFASDINPIALLITKATSEYIYKNDESFLEVLEEYFKYFLKILKDKIEPIYGNGIFFLWVREISCIQCNLKIPLFKNFNLIQKKKQFLNPIIPKEPNNDIIYIIGDKINSEGYFKGGKLKCPRCATVLPNKDVMRLVSDNCHHRLIAIYEKNSRNELKFRIANEEDFKKIQFDKNEIENDLIKKYPDINIRYPDKSLLWRIQKYGLLNQFDFFNQRELKLVSIFLEIYEETFAKIQKTHLEKNIKNATLLYLSLAISKSLELNTTLTSLDARNPSVRRTFSRSGLFMTGSYAEVNPLNENYSGSIMKYLVQIKKIYKKLSQKKIIKNGQIEINQINSMELDYQDESMDYCFTDPPYYDNLTYAVPSDFFYSYLKPMLSRIFPEFFLNKATPKDIELIQDRFRHQNSKKAKDFYEFGMTKSFKEIYRVLKKKGIAIIIFTHKDLNAWETLLQSIIDSKLIITASWPIPMENISRLGTKNTVSLNSVVVLVCRKNERKKSIYFDEKFRDELQRNIEIKLEKLWRLNFKGTDFFLASLGPAMEEISRYTSVLDVKTDNPIEIKTFLNFVDDILVKFSLKKALNSNKSTTDAETQFYLIWKLTFKTAKIPYDELWKFMNAIGLEEKNIINRIIKKVTIKSQKVYVCLDATDKSKIKIFQKANFKPSSLIEAIQFSAFLWEKESSNLDEIVGKYTNIFGQEFWHVAQTICNLTPEAPEVKLISGLLKKFGIGFEKSEEKQKQKQKTLLEY